MNSNKVGFIFTHEYEKYNFGHKHPLRPLRLLLTYSLMEKLGLFANPRCQLLEPRMATNEELVRIHSQDYVDTVKSVSKDPTDKSHKPYSFGLGPGDNPIFEGMHEASALVCGASIVAADKVWNDEDYNVALNISGGLHHAMRNKASGFCIYNDIAVAIAHLKHLKKDIKVAYLDIDCHHGDGVQWLFYNDPNVLTISYHESGKFLFPGTGDTTEIGEGPGEGFSINFPLLPGTSNKMYLKLFRETFPKILEAYRPDIIFTQLGVDTHLNDPLTQMGLSIEAYLSLAKEIENCAVKYCNNKWVGLGGGGYLMTVVPRAWTIYFAKMLDVELQNELPEEWRLEAREKVPYEETPYTLWDRGDKIEVQLLAHPEVAQKMLEYNKMLIDTCNTKFLPPLSKH